MNRHATKPAIPERALQALTPGRHNLTTSELLLLLKLDLIEATGKTADGTITCYSLTGNGRIWRARNKQ
jgi:hypothetical protein